MSHDVARVRRITFILVASLALTLSMASATLGSAKIQHLISPGGIEAWFVQEPTAPLISIEFAFAGGAAQDPAAKAGVANLVANLLGEGSGDLDSKAYHKRLARRAIELSFRATRDTIRGNLRIPGDAKDEASDLLRSALMSPHFDPAAVQRVLSRVIGGLRHGRTRPSSLAEHKFFELAYPDHPYGRQVNGTLDSVPTITIGDMKDYVRCVIAKDTLKIAAVGNIDPVTLGKLLDKTFGALPQNASLRPVSDIEAAKPPKRAFVALDSPQTVIAFGGPAVMRSDPNFMATYVAEHIMGGNGISSRLFHEVRDKRGLAYSISEELLWMDHSAIFVGNAATRAERAGELIDAIENEARRIADEGPTQKELEQAKLYLKGSLMLALDTSPKLARAMLEYQLDRRPIDYVEKYSAIIDGITLEDTKQAAKRLWGQGLLTVVIGRAPRPVLQ